MTAPDMSVVIPALNEAENLRSLLPALHGVIDELGLSAEIILVDGGSRDDTVAVAHALGARPLRQDQPGFAGALLTGFAAAAAPWVLTMDADLSHRPSFVRDLWGVRNGADVVVASRYVAGGTSRTYLVRRLLSRVLNAVYRRALAVPIRDMSGGFRLYRREALAHLPIRSRDFDATLEIVALLYAEGRRIVEVPFQFAPRGAGRSHVRLARFAWSYARTLRRLWSLRRSPVSGGRSGSALRDGSARSAAARRSASPP
jgi:dolichol-phosphate mannosyltransferase